MVGTVNGMVSLVFTSLATGGAIVVSRAKGGIRVASPMGRCDYERADTIPDLKLESGETVTTDGTLIVGIRKL